MYSWALVIRVKKCWDSLKSWLGSNFPEVLTTLRKGASEDELNKLEKDLKVNLPHPTRLLYRLHDGQEVSDKLLGLIGGYSMYDHLVNVNILSLKNVLKASRSIIKVLGFSDTSKYVVVAASLVGNEKVFCINCANKQLYVGTALLKEDGDMMPCVPNEVLKSNSNEHSDGLLLWLEEHSRRLHSGMVAVREGTLKSICQYPEKPPVCSTAVTHGVQVP